MHKLIINSKRVSFRQLYRFNSLRYFGKIAPKIEVVSNDQNAELVTENLKFVKENPMLKQVFMREASDNLFPKMKAHSEYTVSDLEELMK